MTTHSLKTWPNQFHEIYTGRATFTVRPYDRPYAPLDILELYEWNPDAAYGKEKTGRVCHRMIGAMIAGHDPVLGGLEAHIMPGYVVLGLVSTPDDNAERLAAILGHFVVPVAVYVATEMAAVKDPNA